MSRARPPRSSGKPGAGRRKLAKPAPAHPDPVIARFIELKVAHSDSLLFMPIAKGYELLFEDASAASEAIGLRLASAGRHLDADVPRCRVPAARADRVIQALVAKGFRIAVAAADGSVQRDVRRLSTPEAEAREIDERAVRQRLDERARQHDRARAERTTRYETIWRHPLTGEVRKLHIRHTRDYLGQGEDHVEVESATKGEANPLSATGYRSHFIKAPALINAGGPVTFVDGLVQEALRDRKWLAVETSRQQGDLFDWAAARSETALRQAVPETAERRGEPPRPAGRRSRGNAPRRDR